MPVTACYRFRMALTLSSAAFLVACGSVSDTTRSAMNAIAPYKVEVVQGNFVSYEQVSALQPGMSRQQVRDVLGTPLVTSVFHADRWEYIFTIKRQGVDEQNRKLSVFFEGDRFTHAEGDAMPTESEFVSTLGKPDGKLKIPQLQATEEQLAKYPVESVAAQSMVDRHVPVADAVSISRNYPPLEADQ